MAEHIYIPLKDEFYEKTFRERFKGIIVEIGEYRHVIPTSTLLKWIKEDVEKNFNEEIKKTEGIENG